MKCRQENAGRWEKGGYRRTAIFVLGLLLVLAASGCGSSTRDRVPSILGTGVAEEQKEEEPVTGVLKQVDAEEQTITIYSLEDAADMTLNYAGSTYVYDRYDKDTVLQSLDIGEIVDVYYDMAKNKASSICVNKESWREEKVEDITVDQTEKIIKLYKSKYRYADGIVIADEGELTDLISLNDQDELSVRGIDKQIYSICITKGHGYIRPGNYKDFIGGMLEIGYNLVLPITKNMLIPVREGTYTFRMSNGELSGEKTVKVIRNKEIMVDMSEFKAKKIKEGYVVFDIRPAGADLYINGKLTDYDEAVKLKYGKHKIMVTMTGYGDYNGTLNLQDKNPTITINLAERVAEVGDEKSTATPAPAVTAPPMATVPPGSTATGGNNNNNTGVTEDTEGTSSTTTKVTVDEDHTITISGPVGVEVYWNGTYKGTTPCSFTKEIGSATVSLRAEGYQTKSYSVEILNDGKDVTYSFANLIAN